LYDRSGAQIIPETVVGFPKFLELLGDREFEWIATNFDPFREAVTGAKTITTAPRALAGAIARIAMRRLKSGTVSDPAAIEANYVRRSDAELLSARSQ